MPKNQTQPVIDVQFNSLAELEQAYQQQISKGGFFVASDQPLPRTTNVELKFHLPGQPKPFQVSAEVAMASTPEAPMPGMGAGMAFQFEKLSDQINNAFQAAITIARAEGMDAGAEEEAPDQPAEPVVEPDGAEAEAAEGDEDNLDEEEDLDEEEEEEEEKRRDIVSQLNLATGEKLYFVLRKLPLHQKVTAAKRGNRPVRNILLQEGNKKVITFLLQNPRMSVGEVLVMLKMSNLSQEIIQIISKNSSFNQSEEVKYHIVTNPRTQLPLALNVLNSLNVNNLAKLAKSGAVRAQIKSTSLRLLQLRRK